MYIERLRQDGVEVNEQVWLYPDTFQGRLREENRTGVRPVSTIMLICLSN